ncbi:hypothetical protein V5T82_11570 [Magnetovibrio sp. PR-2]|uniref:hypothetical protein n=1 Tax=Magnetovibrio sp. PR-2 TaxID=3120356 RepID=UPI002FCE2561
MTTELSPDFAGRIHVRLGISNDSVRSVDIDSTRPQGVTKMFGGRSAEQTVLMLGMIFSLCSTAQTVAALTACEKALGLQPSDSEQAARDILREAEMLTQTLMRIGMDWPKALGLPPAITAVKCALSAQSELQHAIFGPNDWKRLGGSGFTPNRKAVPDIINGLEDVIARDLYEDGLVDKILDTLDTLGINDFGALGPGQSPEVGALMRHWDTAEVKGARDAYGAGLRARFVSRLVDVKVLEQSQKILSDGLSPCDPDRTAHKDAGAGEAQVETARGALIHKVEIEAGRVKAYDVFAPTDANFEPGGAVELGLKGASVGDRSAFDQAANLHVLAVDPCVLCEVEIGDDG